MKAEVDLSSLHHFPLSFTKTSTLRASLDIGCVLAVKDGVTFKAKGTCMYPTVRPGDVLTVKHRPAADVAVGDIAVCHVYDYLFSHRVINKGKYDNRPYIVTRPDCSHHGSDVQIFDENLLGIVVEIKRRGRPVPLIPSHYSRFISYYHKRKSAFIETKETFKLHLSELLAQEKLLVFYRPVVKTWFMLFEPRLTFVVQVPLNETLGDTVFQSLKPDSFDLEMTLNDRKIGRWTIVAYLNLKAKPDAWITFVRGDDDKWRVAEWHERLRYSGSGLKNELVSQAKIILTRNMP